MQLKKHVFVTFKEGVLLDEFADCPAYVTGGKAFQPFTHGDSVFVVFIDGEQTKFHPSQIGKVATSEQIMDCYLRHNHPSKIKNEQFHTFLERHLLRTDPGEEVLVRSHSYKMSTEDEEHEVRATPEFGEGAFSCMSHGKPVRVCSTCLDELNVSDDLFCITCRLFR